MSYELNFDEYIQYIENNRFYSVVGKVTQVIGLTIVVQGIRSFVGEVCEILLDDSGENSVLAEVVGFRGQQVLLMPLGDLKGVGAGCKVIPTGKILTIPVGEELLGRILDGLGRPMEGPMPP